MPFKLEQLKVNKPAKFLAKRAGYLAKSIQEKLNDGTARIRKRG